MTHPDMPELKSWDGLGIRDHIEYDQETGEFRWKKGFNNHVRVGSIAGSAAPRGYWRVKFRQRFFIAHRLAWWFVNGVIPAGHVDHINGDKRDNRISNLRVVTESENQQAIFRPRRDSTTGFRGVRKTRYGFNAEIRVSKKRVSLGVYRTAEEASAAYLSAKAVLHPSSVASRPYLLHPALTYAATKDRHEQER
jgi:hypothetical protein